MIAPDNSDPQVDAFIVAVEMACVAAFLALFLAVLFCVHYLIAGLVEHHPALQQFMLSPWVAPALIGCGVATLGGVAALLLFAGSAPERERGE